MQGCGFKRLAAIGEHRRYVADVSNCLTVQASIKIRQVMTGYNTNAKNVLQRKTDDIEPSANNPNQ